VIEDTWESLISTTHHDIRQRQRAWADRQSSHSAEGTASDAPPQPYEMVSAQIQSIAHRTSLDSQIFPIDSLLPAVCRYALANNQDGAIGADPAWPVVLFSQLGVSHALVTRVLEQMLDSQEAPFTGKRRRQVVQWVDVVVEDWILDVERRGGPGGKGGEAAMGPWVAELLDHAEQAIAQIRQGVRGAAEAEEVEATRRKTAALRRDVEALLTAAVAQAHLGFGL
jgi:nuclear pore complex protein Nup155